MVPVRIAVATCLLWAAFASAQSPDAGARPQHRGKLLGLSRHQRREPGRACRRSPARSARKSSCKMQEFKSGKRPGTIMPQLAKGYTDEQIDLVAGVVRGADRRGQVKGTAMDRQRRDFLKAAGAGFAVAALRGCATMGAGRLGKVVVVGGGYGGATAAKYLRMWSNGGVDVTLVETNADVHLLPAVEPGARRQQADRRHDGELRRPRQARASRSSATPRRRSTSTSAPCASRAGSELPYDRLVLSPGIDFLYDRVPGARTTPMRRRRCCTRGRRGRRRVALRQQLEAMRDGGVYAIIDPARAVSLPARTVRARLPGRVVLQAREAAEQGADPRRQRGRRVEEGPVHEGVERGVQGHRRVPAELRADRRRRRDADREVRDRRRRARPTC